MRWAPNIQIRINIQSQIPYRKPIPNYEYNFLTSHRLVWEITRGLLSNLRICWPYFWLDSRDLVSIFSLTRAKPAKFRILIGPFKNCFLCLMNHLAVDSHYVLNTAFQYQWTIGCLRRIKYLDTMFLSNYYKWLYQRWLHELKTVYIEVYNTLFIL